MPYPTEEERKMKKWIELNHPAFFDRVERVKKVPPKKSWLEALRRYLPETAKYCDENMEKIMSDTKLVRNSYLPPNRSKRK